VSSIAGRKNGYWRKPETYLDRCVLHVLVTQLGRNKTSVIARFKELRPDYQDRHAARISDGALWSRATSSHRPGYAETHPGWRTAMALYMAEAEKIVTATDKPTVTVPVAPLTTPVTAPPPTIGFEEKIARVSNFRALLGHGGDLSPVYWAPSKLLNHSLLVTGDTGSGKSQCLRALIADVADAGLPVTVLDFKGDYADPAFSEAHGLRVYDIDRGLPFSPLVPVADDRSEVQAIRHITELAAILKLGLGLGDMQVPRFKDAVITAFLNRGIDPRRRYRLADLPASPSWADVINVLRNDPDGKNESLRHRLAVLSDLDLFPDEDTVRFVDMLSGKVVLDLHRLPSAAVMMMMAELFVARLHGHLLRGDQPREFRRLVVFDEAHRMAESQRLIALAREARAFGIGIAIGTQFPGDVPLEMSGNLGTKIFMSASEDKHRRAIAKAVHGTTQGYLAERFLADVGRLRQHQAMIKNAEIAPYKLVNLLPHYRRGLDLVAAE
jgi:hypothetical protein